MPLNNTQHPLNQKTSNQSLDSWRFLRFKEIADLGKERISPQYISPGLACIELENISKETGQMIGITDPSKQSSQKNVFYKGNVLFGKLRPYLKKYMYCDFDGVCSSEIWVLSSKNGCQSKYLFYLIQTSQFIRVADQSSGTKMPRADWTNVSKLVVPIPPIQEQEKMTEILSTWDRAIERVQQLIEAKQRQKDQLVSQLLSGQKRFPGFQDEWKQVRLGTFLHPKFRKVIKPDGAYLRLGIRSHGKGTFTSVVDDPETIALTHLFQARKDDLIVNITFAWEGAIALVGPDGDGALVSHRFPTYVFDTSKMLPEYFRHLMVTDRFFYELDLISPGGAGRNRVMNKGDFLKIWVTIPGVEEQQKIASVLGGMDEQIGLLKKYLEKLKEQKKGLMQKLLTGEIRVKVD
jgi:type I restriction enzyme S subunit